MPAIKQNKKANLVFPSDTPMSNEELANVVMEAEKGPFYTVKEVKAEMAKWKAKYSK